ncbi:MAG: GAF domain-containing protein [Deltaproteobacteria bacterium]|nr:GAF domain-containing protein [Deltaproteobacteria bacterium]
MATRFVQEDARTEPQQSGANQAQREADFEKLLAELSAALIRVSVAEIDSEIERWLERIALAMHVDRCTIGQRNPVDGIFYRSHQWGRPGAIVNKDTNYAREFPWLYAKISSGEIVVSSRVDRLPQEAATDRDTARNIGSKSGVVIPLKIGERVVGSVGFTTVFSTRTWSDETVQRLKLVAEIVGNALERIRAEAEIRRLSEELRRASQVMTMGELTASLAHELNQPLGAISNNAKAAQRMLTARTPDLAEVDAALDDIVRDDARAVDIVKNVRAMFQRGEAKMSPVDVREFLLDVARIVTADARLKDISWSIQLPDSLPLVRGDKTHLTQAVLNLVLNAFDSVCDGDGEREVVLHVGQQGPNEIHVSVRDSGRGIDATVMPRLFEPFFTTKPSGMGMGLAIVRSIIENHGGLIWATPNLDRGATLEFVLPVEPSTSR